jgi:uncharacterized damage-inducible protein DinB
VSTVIETAFDHHAWATLRLLDACQGLTDVQLGTSVPGTYGSIIDTMRHLVGGDASYLNLLTDGRVATIADEGMGIGELRTAMEGIGEDWRALLAEDPDPERIVVRHRDDGSEGRAPMHVRLAQAVHHGTDHRSQVCTALTLLGVEPPEIDVWAFAQTTGSIEETQPTA